MSNWHKRFMELDGSKAQEVAQVFQARLEDLKAKLGDAYQMREGLMAQAPEVLAAHEESLLGDAEAQAKAQADLEALNTAIENVEKKIQAISLTLNRERKSPELGKLAGDLWDMTAGFRSALIELFPDALKELAKAQEDYLKVVHRVGELGVVTARMELIMNKAASPFMPEPKYQPATPLPAIFMSQEAILAAYDPSRLTPIGINALNQPHATADTVLAALKGEEHDLLQNH